MTEIFKDVKQVELIKSRWNLKIKILLQDGTSKIFYASADSGLTWGDGIYFADEEEYLEDRERTF